MNLSDPVKARYRSVLKALLSPLRPLLAKRLFPAAAAVLVTLGMVWIPSSRLPVPRDVGEAFGEIHWYRDPCPRAEVETTERPPHSGEAALAKQNIIG